MLTKEQLEKIENKSKKVIADYLLEESEKDNCLQDKLLTSEKTIDGCFNYIKNYAYEHREDMTACLISDEVFAMAKEYFIEDGLNSEPKPKPQPKPTEEEAKNKENENKAPRNDLNFENEQEVISTPKAAKKAQKEPKKSKKELLQEKLYDGLDLFSI